MGIEDDTRAFLILIVNTIAWVLLWMIVNVLAGIYLGFAFYTETIRWQNILYYVLSAGTFILIVWYLRRRWKL